jgi:hypothetical protein
MRIEGNLWQFLILIRDIDTVVIVEMAYPLESMMKL